MTKEQMIKEINRLKKEKNAIILGHYYQIPEIQEISDITGDSLRLAKEASNTNADIIIFCGVHFMAETAKILSPSKKVLLPVKEAGCPMADMITYARLKEYKDKNPNTKVICYVNSNADVKSLSDVIVTSSNAEKIIKYYSEQGFDILYAPDQNLGNYMMKKHNIKMEVWPGYCCVHDFLTKEMVKEMKDKHPKAEFIAHPEAKLEVLDEASFVGSTSQLLEYTSTSKSEEFIIGTEDGILYQMQKNNPTKRFHLLSSDLKCYDMKLTTIEDLYNCLVNEKYEINVDKEIMIKAKEALDKMLEF